MPYTPNMKASARRHFDAAKRLYDDGKRKDVAGYLYGVAAECAVKAMVRDTGGGEVRGHFPDELPTRIRDATSFRGQAKILNLINNNNFMSNWSTDMRYCKESDIDSKSVAKWAAEAKQALHAMDS